MWSGLLKVFLGFFLAIAIIAGGSYLLARQVIAQLTAPPPKPMFPNDNPAVRQAQKKIAKPSPSPKVVQAAPAVAKPTPNPAASPSPSPSPQAEGYTGQVSLRRGLNLRTEPSRRASKIGIVTYNQKFTVLEESADKQWVKVRLEATGKEGWVFATHTKRIE